MFVRGGYTGLRPSRFTQVRAKVKQFDRPAFLYVPTPSKREDTGEDPGPGKGPDAPTPVPTGGISFGTFSVTGDNAQNAIGNQGGNIRQERS